MKAVISIVGSYTDKFSETDEANLNYSYLRWKDINELISSGRVEFQNHTYNLHDNTHGRIGAKKKKGESDDEYKKIPNIPSNVKIVPYLDDMLSVMKRTDLMVTRAGASTIAEITAIGIPSILIPSPYVTHNHQYKNALVLEKKKAAIIIEEKDLEGNLLIKTIDEVLNDPQKYDIMKKNSENLGIKNSSSKIYEIIKELVNEG